MSEEDLKKSGLKDWVKPYQHQENYVREIINSIETTGKINYFISLPQGAGKTLIGLWILSELLNKNKVNSALILAPRKVLVDQWVEEAQKMFYGLNILQNPTLSKKSISKIRTVLKHSNLSGIGMTIHSFKNFMKKEYFVESDFDLIIVDEASDAALAKDFISKYRMSYYLEGIEGWNSIKLLAFPQHIDESKLENMVKKFGREYSKLIMEKPESIETLDYQIHDPIIIDDPLINEISTVLDQAHKKARRNIVQILDKYNVTGYRENLETLLRHKMMVKIKDKYKLPDDVTENIQLGIIKYILIKHLKRWFLYCNRDEIRRTIFASQTSVSEWLSREDRKLETLKEIVSELLEQNKRVYIYSDYISTADLIYYYLRENLDIGDMDIKIITGEVEDQFKRLDEFKEHGRILISTPVFDKGTDIPQVHTAIVFTPSRNLERIHQVKGRIRGGEIVTLAYKGYEQEETEQIVQMLRD